MPKPDIYLRRDLNGSEYQGLGVLDCIGWSDPTGGMGLRVFFKSGVEITRFDTTPRDGFARFSEARSINGGLVFSGTAPEVSHTIRMALKDGGIELQVQLPETELFADMNVCFAERNGEPIEVIEDWIRYHVERCGLQAVLLLDREKPSNGKGFERKLEALSKKLGLLRLVHLKSGLPLGNPELPPASHPFNSPDAPGKDRMDDLAPDAATSPLAELSIYELVKWRFLGRARAVMNLDLTDLVQDGFDPFEAVHNSSAGVLRLLGQRIYPWRIRTKDQPSFGDHICHQFDNPRANRRWCVAPGRVGNDKIWRFVRIVEAEPQPDEVVPFWRAMAIRHPNNTAAEIVPKTSLIEDPALITQAQEVFGHNPVRAPEHKMTAKPGRAIDGGATCIVTCMKNEGPFILEWVAYHRAIGIENFLIYTNDCTDGTDELLNLLQDRGLVQRRDNLFAQSALKPQHWALAAAEKEELLQRSGWAISMDVDEFINIHVGEGKIDDLYRAVGDANLISLTWRLFGNADIHEFDPGFITSQFDRCAPEMARKPHQAWGFKTLFRNIGIYKKMGVHRPKGLKPDLWDQINWVNGSGRPMPKNMLRNGWRSTVETYGYELATLNHYAVRSAESFLVKRDRGRVNHVDRDQGLSYWFRMNNNAEQDTSILSKEQVLQVEFDRLMADPEIAAQHHACVAAHRDKITELRATDNYEAFYRELSSARMERLSRLHTHFGANVFLSGPEVIPEDIWQQDTLPDDFFFTVERTKTTH